jgi:L-asparagine transporter-like permease
MSRDDERFKNLMLFKIWATDKEMEEMVPIIAVILIIGLIVLGIYLLLK